MNAVGVPANALAYAVLFGWPLVAAILFARMPLERAAAWSLIGGFLLLPSGLTINPPLIPPIDKASVTVVSTLILCLAKGGMPRARTTGVLTTFLAIVYVLAPVAATFNNSYELRIGTLSLPGYYLLDGIKGAILNLIQISAFYIGARFFSTSSARLQLLKILVMAMLLYSIPILIEARLSPQVHRWVYGYSPFSFASQVRWGGYRPVVFLPNGLMLALLVTMALIGACVLARTRIRVFGQSSTLAATYLGPILLLCKTLGAVIYSVVAVPIALFCRPATCVRVAAALMIIVCIYPGLRTAGLSPIETVTQVAESVSADRQASFLVRVKNENALLAKANEKPFFGWGEWGRNRIYDATLSRDVSITDGGWIIYFGMFGWFGYLGLFGMFTVPVLRLGSFVKHADRQDALAAAGLAMMLAINIIDMLPNANLTPITFLIGGSIARKLSVARAAKRTMKSNMLAERSSEPRPGFARLASLNSFSAARPD